MFGCELSDPSAIDSRSKDSIDCGEASRTLSSLSATSRFVPCSLARKTTARLPTPMLGDIGEAGKQVVPASAAGTFAPERHGQPPRESCAGRERINAQGCALPVTVSSMFSQPQRSGRSTARALAVLLAGAGTSHFAIPKIYDAMIPEQLPGPPRAWTYGAGVAEVAVATALALPPTRRLGGLAAAGLFVGVLPGNVKMAVDAHHGSCRSVQLGTLLRLPMQLPLILAAWRVYRRA